MTDWPQLIGESPPIKALKALITQLLGRVARGSRPPAILILGETGTGKGLIAGLLHRMSGRAAGAFVDVNCAAIPEPLMEAELFGYERGAFTDAHRSKPGLFQTAHRGTLFLDEVALLPLTLQAKLLAVLEERAVRRLGATEKEPVDAWVISATNVDLAREVRDRCFREDLYHRLTVMTIRMPALRERPEDIDLLADHFLERARADYGLPALSLAPEARERLRAHSWPGNVRELANAVERAALLGDAPRLTAAAFDLGESRPAAPAVAAPGPRPPLASRDAVLREHLHRALCANGWNISRTAEVLGMSRNTLRARIQKFGLCPDDVGSPPARAARPPSTPGTAWSPGRAGVDPEAHSPSRLPGLVRWNGAALPSGL